MSGLDNQTLYDSLKAIGIIPPKILDEVLAQAQKEKKPLSQILLSQELIDETNLAKLTADLFKIPFIDLTQERPPLDILRLIPEVIAKKQKIVAFKQDKQGLHLATTQPDNLQEIELIRIKTGLPVNVYLTTTQGISDTLAGYGQDLSEKIETILKTAGKEPPMIELVDSIIEAAHRNKASDVHFEPTDKDLVIRFRIDGILHDLLTLPANLYPHLITRVKVMAKLPTDEHQAALDGKIRFSTELEKIDIRISILPTIKGEKIAMRLLSERTRHFSLTNLGLSEPDLVKIRSAYKRPYGMILATGPTGCGKTTTLYTILKLINTRDVNIMTIEDPVEYDIAGINQIQVNPQTNLTFAKGLKSIVRQDPDIILVGEIRDEETAGIAVNASLTGHLMLSTLHTNDAATAIPRLLDMGIEPFLIASTVNIIIAQRLVRRICSVCRVSQEIDLSLAKKHFTSDQIKKYFGTKSKARVYVGKGIDKKATCPNCHGTGFSGRIGIFEVMKIDDRLQDAIVSRQSADKIRELAVKAGMTTMTEGGLSKVKEGITTIDELIRVTKEE